MLIELHLGKCSEIKFTVYTSDVQYRHLMIDIV